jgi:RNase_H superfamily
LRILALDIETRPTLAYVWGLWNQNIGLNQIVDPGGMICFASKWVGQKKIEFVSDFHDGHEAMVDRVWDLLDEADMVLHYNGASFDVPHIQREFMELHKLPPSPFKQIDLLKTVRKKGRFVSNKLAHIAPQLGLQGKVHNEGFPLWVKCMEGDAAAWKRMKRYNVRDVTELEKLYSVLLPWIPGHPSHGAQAGLDVCPSCGSGILERRGYAMTQTGKFQRFQCKDCGSWSRSNTRVEKTSIVQIAD